MHLPQGKSIHRAHEGVTYFPILQRGQDAFKVSIDNKGYFQHFPQFLNVMNLSFPLGSSVHVFHTMVVLLKQIFPDKSMKTVSTEKLSCLVLCLGE